jgi:periplasmic divalent cation tolerance protein
MKQADYIVVFITAGSLVEAESIADMLVTAKLAACVSIVPEVKSVFSWKGNIENEKETLLIVKSKSSVFKELVGKVREMHKYEVPEIIALPIIDGSGHYLDWMEKEIKE